MNCIEPITQTYHDSLLIVVALLVFKLLPIDSVVKIETNAIGIRVDPVEFVTTSLTEVDIGAIVPWKTLDATTVVV